ncbi:MAG: MBL fold metallo-hydrolase [Anaerovoracaceae bacterium]
MELSFCSFASGSSGNCYLVKSRESAILIDAGISTKRIHAAMDEIGIVRDEIQGVFITHEHSDHIKALRVLTKQNPNWSIYASNGTKAQISEHIKDEEKLIGFTAGSSMEIADMRVRSMKVSHDAADPVCYSVTCGKSKLVILTDTGYVPEEVKEEMSEAEVIVMEANHEVNMLKMGAYPYSLKQRILGDKGHLSNVTAGETLAEVMKDDGRYRRLYLAHLSQQNNFPGLALQTVKNILEEYSFVNGKHFSLDVMRREMLSGITEL